MPIAQNGRAPARARTSACRVALTAAAGVALALASAPPALADDCPNAVVRAQQGTAHLPECRAYELVSPASKNGHSIQYAPVSDPAGGGISFSATGAFADAPASINGQYYARRTDGGWNTRSYIFPTRNRLPYPGDEPAILQATSDLSTAVIRTGYPIDSDDQSVSNTYDIFRRTADGQFDWLGHTPSLPDVSEEFVDFVAASTDLERVAMSTRKALAPPIASEAATHLYAREGNSPAVLVSVGTDGLPAALSVSMALASDDLSRIPFVSGGRLLMRFDPFDPARATTRAIALGSDGTTECTDVVVTALSADGRKLVFRCGGTQPLTPDAVAGRFNLYLRDIDTGAIRWLAAGTSGVRAYSPDLSRIWISDSVARRTVIVRDGVRETLDLPNNLGGSDISADGEWSVGTSSSSTLPGANGASQVYRVSARERSVICISCPADGSRPAGSSSVAPTGIYANNTGYSRPRYHGFISDDGRRVFFNSDRALVPEDRNGVTDAYVWIDGRHHLLSSGTDAEPSAFVNASADGRDAFIITAESLIPQDVDNGVADVYDVRIDGGFPVEPAARRCVADCQGPPPADQHEQTPGTVVFHGPDDSDDPIAAPTAKVFAVQPLGAAARRALARGRAATLRVRVSDAGRVQAAMRTRVGRRTVQVGSASRTTSEGGTVRLTLRLSAQARKQLRRAGTLRVTVRVTWSQQRGAQQATFVLRAPAPRGGRR